MLEMGSSLAKAYVMAPREWMNSYLLSLTRNEEQSSARFSSPRQGARSQVEDSFRSGRLEHHPVSGAHHTHETGHEPSL